VWVGGRASRTLLRANHLFAAAARAERRRRRCAVIIIARASWPPPSHVFPPVPCHPRAPTARHRRRWPRTRWPRRRVTRYTVLNSAYTLARTSTRKKVCDAHERSPEPSKPLRRIGLSRRRRRVYTYIAYIVILSFR